MILMKHRKQFLFPKIILSFPANGTNRFVYRFRRLKYEDKAGYIHYLYLLFYYLLLFALVLAAFFAATERFLGPFVLAAFLAAAERSAALRFDAAECACLDNAV